MKKIILLFVFIIGAQVHASCSSAALTAAQDAYGSYIYDSKIAAVRVNKEYLVTVGIGNVEDGPHIYRVTFVGKYCNPMNAQICDLTQPGQGPSEDCK